MTVIYSLIPIYHIKEFKEAAEREIAELKDRDTVYFHICQHTSRKNKFSLLPALEAFEIQV